MLGNSNTPTALGRTDVDVILEGVGEVVDDLLGPDVPALPNIRNIQNESGI